MNKDLTEIVVVLDKSGSMGPIRHDTIGGFNTMLSDQQKETNGKALLTLVAFNGSVDTVVNGIDVHEVEPLTDTSYRPDGGTALLDAIGKTIDNLESRYEDAEPEAIPSKVLFIIITDGQENTSKEYDKARIQKMIKHQTKRHGYEFIFLGANLDSVSESGSIGVARGQTLNFIPDGVGLYDTFGTLSKTASMYRSNQYNASTLHDNAVGTSLNVEPNGNLTVSGDVVIKGKKVDLGTITRG